MNAHGCHEVEGRLSADVVRYLERLVGGDPMTEQQVLRFIEDRYGARSLAELPAKVASEVVRRPGDFIAAARSYCEPELF